MENLQHTISEMYRLAWEDRRDVAGLGLKSLQSIFDHVKNIRYVRDIDSCGVGECLMRPLYGNYGGDCDDKAIFAGAALYNIGVPFRYVTVAYNPEKGMQHVYLEILDGGKWKPFDATYSRNKLFTEPRYVRKITWRNPYMNTNQFVVLEGEDLGLIDPVSVTGIITGTLNDIKKILSSLPLIGGLFRGKTQTIPYEIARAKQVEVWDKWNKIFDSLDDAGKKKLYELSELMIESWVRHYGAGWDNHLNNEVLTAHNSPDWNKEPLNDRLKYRTGFNLSIFVFVFLIHSDINWPPAEFSRLFDGAYVIPLNDFVIKNLNDYLSSQGQSVVRTDLTRDTSTGQASFLPSFDWKTILLVGGLLFMVISVGKKKSRRKK